MLVCSFDAVSVGVRWSARQSNDEQERSCVDQKDDEQDYGKRPNTKRYEMY